MEREKRAIGTFFVKNLRVRDEIVKYSYLQKVLYSEKYARNVEEYKKDIHDYLYKKPNKIDVLFLHVNQPYPLLKELNISKIQVDNIMICKTTIQLNDRLESAKLKLTEDFLQRNGYVKILSEKYPEYIQFKRN